MKIHDAISAALPEPVAYSLTPSTQPTFGDFACNAAMILAKKLNKNPREIATQIIKKLAGSDLIAKAEVAGPGFINIFLQDAAVWDALAGAALAPVIQKEKVIIEYGSENIAKPMSIGHLRSNIIGKSLVNIFEFIGQEVITDNHLGDWGTQFGKLIVAYKKWGDRAQIEKDPIRELNKIYVRFHDEAKSDLELETAARAAFKKLEDGDTEMRELWKWMKEESLKEFQIMYDRLESRFDHFYGEAFYEDMLPIVVKDCLAAKIAVQNDDGSVMVEFPEAFSPSPFLIQKSDGATLYATRDLATIRFRRDEFAPDRVLYCVGADQILHFRQLFNTAERLNWSKVGGLVHIVSGMVSLPEGKMSTRSGRTIRLGDLLDTAEEKMREIIATKNCEVEGAEREQLIRDLSVGAVKFADLGRDRESNITFSWEQALSFEGYAAPYLMYTHARAKSILRKASEVSDIDFQSFSDPAERVLAMKLLQFSVAVEKAATSYKPHHIAQYIFDLAQEFNSFYHHASVMNAESELEKQLRLALVTQTAEILKVGLGLLGITAPERM